MGYSLLLLEYDIALPDFSIKWKRFYNIYLYKEIKLI